MESFRNSVFADSGYTSNDDSKKEWLDWAKKKLDWDNPMLNIEDEILKDVDKDLLEFFES